MQVNLRFQLATAAAFALVFLGTGWVQAADRPNILWLIAEDFGNQLGCCGTREVSTPNLDTLAARGVRYSRFYTTAPVCSPSRSAFMTGMYQTTIGAHHHRSHRDDGYLLPPGVRILTDWFRDGRYFTANLRELPPGFGFKGTAKTDWNFTPPEKPFDSQSWADLKTHQPFYAQLNFRRRIELFMLRGMRIRRVWRFPLTSPTTRSPEPTTPRTLTRRPSWTARSDSS